MIPHPIITAAFVLTAFPASAVTLLLNPGFEAIALAPATSITVTDADFESGETSPQVTPWAAGGNSVYLAKSLPKAISKAPWLQEENSLVPLNAKITIPDFCETMERYYGK